ncbi:MAG TPA: ATP-binding cassette domain-containing protein, partial [Burkholderiaceae bacterium]|nr:ATP-binding cassette domain-containing protein [Burkholderiaceae bacterium]
GRALLPVEQLIAGWKALLDARAAWQRIEQRDGKAVAGASAVPLALPAPRGRLDVERLVFGAPGSGKSPLIKAVSFTLEAGQSLGIVGASAAGKTTLLRLLLGLWRPQAGVVRLDGADIAQWDRDGLGRHIGYLPQDVELFAGTVAENIARLGEPDAEAVVAAARAAHAHKMILRLPQGYDTPVGEAGHALSGGQRQRIALARALYGSPCLVVLDEPNSNLDAEGDVALLKTLAGLKARGATVIMVAHRPALMSQLDKLAVLKDGALALYGPAADVGARLKAVPAAAAARPAPPGVQPIDASPLAPAAVAANA